MNRTLGSRKEKKFKNESAKTSILSEMKAVPTRGPKRMEDSFKRVIPRADFNESLRLLGEEINVNVKEDNKEYNKGRYKARRLEEFKTDL